MVRSTYLQALLQVQVRAQLIEVLVLDVNLMISWMWNAVKLLCSSMVPSPLVQALVQVCVQLIEVMVLDVNVMFSWK